MVYTTVRGMGNVDDSGLAVERCYSKFCTSKETKLAKRCVRDTFSTVLEKTWMPTSKGARHLKRYGARKKVCLTLFVKAGSGLKPRVCVPICNRTNFADRFRGRT